MRHFIIVVSRTVKILRRIYGPICEGAAWRSRYNEKQQHTSLLNCMTQADITNMTILPRESNSSSSFDIDLPNVWGISLRRARIPTEWCTQDHTYVAVEVQIVQISDGKWPASGPGRLPPKEKPPYVSINWKAGWGPGAFWRFGKKKNSFLQPGIEGRLHRLAHTTS